MEEYRLLKFVCSETGERFNFLMGRMYDDDPFRPVKIVPDVLELAAATKGTSTQTTTDNKFSFQGWQCICGWGDKPTFIRCGKCSQLACGKRSYEMGGVRYFKCTPDCGHSGQISGSIESYSTTKLENETLLEDKPKLLLPE